MTNSLYLINIKVLIITQTRVTKNLRVLIKSWTIPPYSWSQMGTQQIKGYPVLLSPLYSVQLSIALSFEFLITVDVLLYGLFLNAGNFIPIDPPLVISFVISSLLSRGCYNTNQTYDTDHSRSELLHRRVLLAQNRDF